MLAPTRSASVELFVFNFCLFELDMIRPLPRETAPPGQLFMSACTAYDALTEVFITGMLSADTILGISMVECTYCNSCRNLAQSSTSDMDTLVHRNTMVG